MAWIEGFFYSDEGFVLLLNLISDSQLIRWVFKLKFRLNSNQIFSFLSPNYVVVFNSSHCSESNYPWNFFERFQIEWKMCEKILSVLQHKFSIHRTRFFCLKENEKLLIGIPRPSTVKKNGEIARKLNNFLKTSKSALVRRRKDIPTFHQRRWIFLKTFLKKNFPSPMRLLPSPRDS